MKAKLILINMVLSFSALSVDTERTPLWAVLLIVAWFLSSALLFKYAYVKGWFKFINHN